MARNQLSADFHPAGGIGALGGPRDIFVHAQVRAAVTVRVALNGFGQTCIGGLPNAAISKGDLALARAQTGHRMAVEHHGIGVVIADELLLRGILFCQLQ